MSPFQKAPRAGPMNPNSVPSASGTHVTHTVAVQYTTRNTQHATRIHTYSASSHLGPAVFFRKPDTQWTGRFRFRARQGRWIFHPRQSETAADSHGSLRFAPPVRSVVRSVPKIRVAEFVFHHLSSTDKSSSWPATLSTNIGHFTHCAVPDASTSRRQISRPLLNHCCSLCRTPGTCASTVFNLWFTRKWHQQTVCQPWFKLSRSSLY